MGRVPPPSEIQDQVLLLSRRRCCICYGHDGDLTIKQGQIAHLDHDPANNDLDNLAFLCLPHHDQYDGKTSQSKGLRASEVKHLRKELYDRIAAGLPGDVQSRGAAISQHEQNQDEPLPNVGSLRPEIVRLSYHPQSDIFRKTSLPEHETDACQGVLLPFSNDPHGKNKTLPVEGLKARITYYKGDEANETKRIDAACWVGESYGFVRLDVGGIVYLIAALSIGGHGAFVESATPSLVHYGEERMLVDHLPDGKYEVKVKLMAGEHGEYSAEFWFELEIGEHLKCKRIMPR